ncbi:berberine bridge enzyme-like 13 [Cajanus cajan]|uniref:berberine bridge enzyme-like 13 n=1 Tax=Cajanus cajan TaxID=3821 RepID=UPI00098D82A6|nr:berberine bridge enzyme-like 13 [Cajanus cajan]
MAFTYINLVLLSISIFISIFPETSISVDIERGFLQCFSSGLEHSNSTAEVILTQNSSSYTSLLQSSIRNLRFLNSSVPKPKLIVTPRHLGHIQRAITCSRKHGLQVRVRSGGHDYEGLSYVSDVPFLIIDLINFRSISIDINDESAWVEAGATLGELYYAIAKKSNVYGFPAGSCPTVGVGGHLSGGGFGTIFRKYGLAADNVIDAEMVDVNGNILNRTLMGEDLFWAIRGGGGSSLGIITAWKVKLVPIPPTLTIFNVPKTLEQGASSLFQKWQTIADKLPSELFLHSVMGVDNSSYNSGRKTVVVSFTGLYLGKAEKLLPWMQNNFPELGLHLNNCTEMSWIQSVLYFTDYPINGPLEILLHRNQTFRSFKAKSDYVTDPIPVAGLEGLWNMLLEENSPILILTPYGGRMSEISGSETPFPHRNGSIYGIQYLVYWDSNEETPKHIDWMRRLYAYMAPYVSKCPRAAYLNYRDLDLGVNRGNTSYEEAKSWGLKYFKFNFERLARVKAEVDPSNFFWHEQSIPPLFN